MNDSLLRPTIRRHLGSMDYGDDRKILSVDRTDSMTLDYEDGDVKGEKNHKTVVNEDPL